MAMKFFLHKSEGLWFDMLHVTLPVLVVACPVVLEIVLARVSGVEEGTVDARNGTIV